MGGTLQELVNALCEMDRLEAADIVRLAKLDYRVPGLYNQ